MNKEDAIRAAIAQLYDDAFADGLTVGLSNPTPEFLQKLKERRKASPANDAERSQIEALLKLLRGLEN